MTIESVTRAPLIERRAIDRWFYVGLTAFFAAVAVVGFGPNSSAILRGALPNPPLVVHVHAALMVAWLALLVAQASLMGAGRRELHMRLGLASLALVPAILVTATATTVVRYYDGVEAGAAAVVANIVFLQLGSLILFPLFVIWALVVRERDSETHKRMMILAAVVVLGAATARMTWVPGNNLVVTNNVSNVVNLLILAPALVYDVARFGRVHRAYVVGLALIVPWMISEHFIWNTAWWRAAAEAIMGLSS